MGGPTRLGVAAVAVSSYVVGLPWALEPDVPLIVLALLAAFIAQTRRCQTGNLIAPLGMAVLAFGVATLVASATSSDPARCLRLSVPLLPGLLIFVLMAGYFEHDDDMLMTYTIYSGVALWLAGGIIATSWWHRPADPTALMAVLASPLLVVPNDGVFFAVVAPFSAGVLAADASHLRRTLAVLSLAAGAGAIAILESRIATLSMLLGLVVWVAVQGRGRVLIALVLGVLVIAATDAVRGFPLGAKLAHSLEWNPRVALWWSALAMAGDAPILGHGPHSFGILYQSYLATLDLPPWLPVDARVAPWPHNLFLETLAEQGAIGLSALIMVLGGGAWIVTRAARTAAGKRRTLAASTLAALIAFAVAATCELSFIRHWVVVLFLTLIGAVACISGREDA